jgi:hypothetical protein
MSSLSFLYITQTAAGLPRIYECLRQKEFVLLSYKEKTPDTHIFLPKSTWTTGRNALREYAMGLEKQYDYYVFLDADVVFDGYSQADGFNKLEELVNTYRPAIAIPQYKHWEFNKIIQGAEVQTTIWYDGICNVFSRDSLISSEIFPYVDQFDSSCWWTSQLIMIILCSISNKEIIMFNNLIVVNTSSTEYPRGSNWIELGKDYVFNTLGKHGELVWDKKDLRRV